VKVNVALHLEVGFVKAGPSSQIDFSSLPKKMDHLISFHFIYVQAAAAIINRVMDHLRKYVHTCKQTSC
jgi:hypothetical protein